MKIAYTGIMIALVLLSACTSPNEAAPVLQEKSSSQAQSKWEPKGQSAAESLAETGESLSALTFLSEKQKQLYIEGRQTLNYFEVTTGFDSMLDDLSDSIVEVDDLPYLPCKGGTYETWDDFYSGMMQLYTREYFEQINNDPDKYISIQGRLYFLDGARGTDPTYLGEETDTFILRSMNEKRIEFDLIGHYREVGAAWDDPSTTEYCSNVLEKTDEGWRFAKITLPY